MMYYSMGINCQKCGKYVTFYYKVENISGDLFPSQPKMQEKITKFPVE